MPLLQVSRNPSSPPGPPVDTSSYFGAVESIAGSDFHYWNFQDGGDRKGPFRDWGTASTISFTPTDSSSIFGFVHCGPRGPDYVGGVVARKWSASSVPATQPQRLNGSAMPDFAGPGAIGFWARRGDQSEKHLLLAQVQNAGGTVFYRTRLKILSDGKLELTIELPGSGNSVVVVTDAEVWAAADRMQWKFVVIGQPRDGGGIDVFVENAPVAVTRTYNGTATAASWIDDMLAYVDRDSGNDVFRIFSDETGDGGEEYSQTGIGGLWIVEGKAVSAADVDTVWDAAKSIGALTDYVEGILGVLTERPVWWWNCHPVNSAGVQPNEAREGKEQNRVETVGIALPSELRGLPLSGGGRRYAAYTVAGLSANSDRISGQDAEAAADWQDWVYTSGSLGGRVRIGTVDSGSGINQLFCWGQEPTSGPSLQEGIVVSAVRVGGPGNTWRGAIRIAFYARTSSALVWWRDFDAQLSDDQEIDLVISQPADGGGPRCWVDGVEITTTDDVTNTTPAVVGPDSWFAEISARAGGAAGINCFRVGSYINASGFNPFSGGVEDFFITDQVLTQAEVDAIEAAVAEGEAYAPSSDFFTVTIGIDGTIGSEIVGFDDSLPLGGVSGAPAFLGGGDAVEAFFWDNGVNEFEFRVSGTYPQDSFQYLTFQGPFGLNRVLSRKAKSFVQAGGTTTWVFDAPTVDWSRYLVGQSAIVFVDF